MKRLLVVLAMVGALVPVGGGAFQSVSAGSGSASSCSDGAPWRHWEIPILTAPITLALEVPHPEILADPPHNLIWNTHVRLCYSTSPAGYSGPDTTGGAIEVKYTPHGPAYGDLLRASCTPESNNPQVVTTSCYAGTPDLDTYTISASTAGTQVSATATESSTGSHGVPTLSGDEGNTTYRFSVPITFCTSSCNTVAPGAGTTGVIVGSVDLAPWGMTGVGTSVLEYCVNGTCQPFPAPIAAGVGVNRNYVQMHNGTPLGCLYPSPWCPWGGAHTSGTLAAVQVGSTVIPVAPPSQCVDSREYYYAVWGIDPNYC